MAIRILIADDSDLTLLGARMVLESDHRYQVTDAVRSLDELVDAVGRCEPDVIVCSEWLADADVLLVLERLRRAAPTARLIVTGSHRDGLLIRDLFHNGVSAYLYRADDLRLCLSLAVDTAMRGRPYLSPTANAEYLVAMQSRRRRQWRLDAQSRLVLRLLARGLGISEIAERLDVPARRIYWVREKLRRRFNARTNEHLIQRATAEGFIYTRD